ncbi:uncharacterized protein KY384_000822 [Bacidia gigantensis]|uniref:uncharacterized protein n=1 Tax=Bacidia gigantensis TaxID=2732470 RepID=UPI001D04083E|nr:uncharacterized protein KY384_000822 [Bacidia gigantensis]KAG8526060.1 hypothetical protein KY384_000822 [Bacidia gigantensis]
MPPKNRGAEIKAAQDAALASLPDRALYIIMHFRKQDDPSNFHWGYYYHRKNALGSKYHFQNPGPGGQGWLPGHASTHGVFRSFALTAVIQIAHVPVSKEAQLDAVMRSYDESHTTIPNMSCRIWLLAVLKRLVEAGLVRCKSIDALEEECRTIGAHHFSSALKNEQPRPVVVSTTCEIA